jgi:hypothetical protein
MKNSEGILMPAVGDESRERANVFLSYSRKDAAVARQLLTALEGRRIDAWVDWEVCLPIFRPSCESPRKRANSRALPRCRSPVGRLS